MNRVAPGLIAIAFTACQVEVLHDLQEVDANAVVGALDRSGIRAEKIRSTVGNKTTYTVSVPRSRSSDAWVILRHHKLPTPPKLGLAEVFGEVGLVPTPTQERALLEHAVAGEITQTLQAIGGVEEARVRVVIPRRRLLDSKAKAEPRASVLLKVQGDLALAESDVQRLVAGAVEALEPSAVQVAVVRSGGASIPPSATSALVSVGPFRVATESRTGLLTLLITSILALVTMGLVVLMYVRRSIRLTRTLEKVRTVNVSTGVHSLDSSLSLIGHSVSGAAKMASHDSAHRAKRLRDE